ncbi:carbohydrate-binding protein [Plantactinospora sp. CA-294935]|uniref:rhamnogalacturonan lyase family protein n=1 Tax=Plantactinospora sp. CA-294935 TaxID=3240012 RepID=UPI003D8F80A7
MPLTLAVSLSLFGFSSPAASAAPASSPRKMEYLTRGLVAAQTPDGVLLSWRFLGNEPDGISWNVYRKDGDADFVKITTIAPRDVQPESDYDTNPGIVKEDVTPSNYTDPDGVLASVYEVAPVVDGVEGERQGMSVPMLSALAGQAGQANRGAATYIPLKPAPAPVPLVHFTYRGQRFGPGTNLNAANMVIPGTGNQNWYVVDMDLLRAFRVAYDDQATVTQEQLDGWVATLNEHNMTPNALGVATYTTARPLTNSLVNGKITEALYNELEAEFIKYVENLDSGTSLPYAKTSTGAVHTSQSSAYSTHDMTVGDFDGDGEYEIVVKWRSTQQDPMYSEPIFGGSNTTTAPEYIDAYKLDGTLLFRVDMGYNVRAANDHETTLFSEDFDGDGKAELMLKTGLGTRIGNWDEASQSVVYPDTLDTVVGGEDGLKTTTDKFEEYFASGNTAALDTYWSLLNSFTISYRSPVAGGGNDGVNDPALKRWIKTYHVGPIGPAKDDQEFFSAFEWDADAGKGVLMDSAKYPFPYEGSVDGDNWAMTPATQRGNFSYLAYPGPGAGSGPGDYKSQMMAPSEAYWLEHPWKAAVWGDAQGNRGNRYVGVVAALDGKHNYAVSQRGYYVRTTMAAFRIVDGKVTLQASFDSDDPQYWSLGGTAYDYQNRGNHHTDSGDLDGDGRDEIVMKAMVLDLNADGTKILPEVVNGDTMPTIEGQNSVPPVAGSFEFATDAVRNNPLNTWAPLRHGDRSALLPVDKDNNVRMWSGSEENLLDDIRTGRQHGWMPGPEAHDPMKGKRRNDQGEVVHENSMIFGVYAGTDAEGAVAGNFSNRWPGAQGHSQNGARSMVTGELLNGSHNVSSGQYAIWFGGGLTAMAASNATISTVDDLTFTPSSYLATGLTSTGNKSTPTLKADLLGDWREELVLRASGNRLAIVTTLSPTEYGIRTLMHDPMYRLGVANKNTGYDQFGFASFYLGDEAELPPMRTDISVPAAPDTTAPTITVKPESKGRDGVYSNVSFKLFDAGKVDKLTLNGVEKDLTDNTHSDLNGVAPGAFGGKAGSNELKVYDVAGNVTTLTFVLDVTGPTVTVKDGATETVGTATAGYELVSFKLFDAGKVDKLTLNGVEKDLTDNTHSDLNGVKPGVFGAVLGANELRVYDVAGNVTTVAFALVEPKPAVPAWDSKKVYKNGDQVSYNGAIYIAQWWTQNEKPGSTTTGSWIEQGALVPAAGADVRAWTASWVYTGGEVVAYHGHTWKARWWTRNQQPGGPNGPWQDLGTY